jgi:co-chaperonin GroES (HSP10)|tara:strand:+ start:1979 stop:2254 length:276 start_codon:yes stop_codon:yes gene_type:complete
MSKIRPIGDRLLIKQHSAEETYTNTNIYIPESNQTKEDRGTVVGIGDEVKGVFEGEVVLFNQFVQPVKVDHMDESHLLLRQQDVWAIVDDE